MAEKILMFENKQLRNIDVSDTDVPTNWHLYWLKKNEYNSCYHSPFKGAVTHQHSFFEVHILTAGEVEYDIGEDRIKVEAGGFLIVCPQSDHVCVSRSDVLKKISVGFEISIPSDHEASKKLELLRNMKHHQGKTPKAVHTVLDLIMDCLNEESEFVSEQKRALLNVFIMSVFETLPSLENEKEVNVSQKSNIGISDETVYNAVVQYLLMNLNQNVTIKELSSELLISISQLNRRLFRYSGMSYKKIKDMVKCARARELLGTEMSMAQISEALGIGNEYSFNRFFKRVEGMTPGKFREALQTSNYK